MINLNDKLLSEADADELYLLLHIVKYMNAENFAWPSNATLCDAMKWEIKKLQRVKARCIYKCLIEVVPRYRAKGGASSNGYRILTSHLGVFTNMKGKGHPQNGIGEDGQRIPQNGIGGISQNGTPPIPQNGIGGHTPKRDRDISINKKEVLTTQVLTNDLRDQQPFGAAPDVVIIEIDEEPFEQEQPVIYLNEAQPEKEKKVAAKKEKGPGPLAFQMWEVWAKHHQQHYGIQPTKDGAYMANLKLLAGKLAQKVNENRGLDFNAKVADEDILAAFDMMLLKILSGSDMFYKENFTPNIFNSKFLNIYQKYSKKLGHDKANGSNPDKWAQAWANLTAR